MFNKVVTITREVKEDATNSTGGYSYPDTAADNSDEVVIQNYRCKFKESYNYNTSDTGINISGKVTMIGQLVKQGVIKEGDKVDEDYKVIGTPKNYRSKTICQLVRLD